MIRDFTTARVALLCLTATMVLAALSTRASGKAEAVSGVTYLPLIARMAPTVSDIREPLLIDGEEGRIYARAAVNGALRTVVLATADGRYLYSYPYAGRLALDRSNQRLLIDQGDAGVAVLDSISGNLLGVIELPPSGPPPANPQVDPGRDVAHAFRGNVVYDLDVSSRAIIGSRTLNVPLLVCGDPQGAAPITRSYYDLISGTLYVSFNTWACTGFLSDTIHIYDAATWYKWGEYDTPSHYQASAFAGNLYGVSHLTRLSMHAYWARSRTETWYEENGGGDRVSLAGSVVDWARSLLYEAIWVYQTDGRVDRLIRVSDTSTRLSQATVSYDRAPIQNARLVGHDPHSDQLYFLDGGALYVEPTTSVLPVSGLAAGDAIGSAR